MRTSSLLPPAAKLVVLCMTVILVAGLSAARAAERPNVILVMTDDQGYGELSCHGNPVLSTPNLDQLASQSIRLTDFHAAPMCTPTRGQLMTGIHALRNGAMNVSSGRTLLRPELTTMADLFKSAGYHTGIFGKWHLGDNYPYRPQDRGFDESLWFPSSHTPSVPDYWNNDYFDDVYTRNGEREQYEGYCTDIFFREAMEWISAKSESGEPFFAYIPTNAPHGPLFVPDKYRPPIREALRAAADEVGEISNPESLISYLAMCANIDENMGKLEAFLQENDLVETTIVIFLTDNGSTMGPRYYNAGMKGSKVTLWEGGHRVPCFIRWPGGELREPSDVNELTQVQDLLPTLAELCNLPGLPEDLDGTSLASLLRGETDQLADRMLVVHYSRMPTGGYEHYVPDNPAVPKRDGAAVLWRRWRMLEDKELYNLEQDPHQDNNVIDQHPEVAAKMREHLYDWWSEIEPTVNEPQRVIIGSDEENPLMLTACEWFDVFVDQQAQVRRGARKNGTWHLTVDQPGTYRFELRRWPVEADVPLTDGVPIYEGVDGRYSPGEALPIAQASIEVGEHSGQKQAEPGAKAVSFEVDLEAGDIELMTTFADENGEEICGAYYVYVTRL